MKYIKTNFVYHPCETLAKHVHEIQGYLDMTIDYKETHNHTFATVSDEAIPIGTNDHIHEVRFKTDPFHHHTHEFTGRTTGAILVGDRHVHFLQSETVSEEGHKHTFSLVTLMDNSTEKDK